MSTLTEEITRNLVAKTSVPVVLRGYVTNWSLCQWNLEKWCSLFGDRKLPFRCMKKDFISDEPCWERMCKEKCFTFTDFVDAAPLSEDWMYFDYKYVHEWFAAENELYKAMSWEQFGYKEKGPNDSTLWIGTAGAHTPAHKDTYGVNIVTQIYGKKRWILFPPETGGMKPTRVPYEESSVYSELNFYCTTNIDVFKGLSGGRMVELSAGDALLVPRGWWHYVQNLDPVNISLNMWLPHENDKSTQVSEALIKIFVAQVCKDLPQETAKLIVNPNEDDISDTPLAVLFLQLETVANSYLESRRKGRRAKRRKTCEDPDLTTEVTEPYDFKALLEHRANNLEIAPTLTADDIVALIKQNVSRYTRSEGRDEADGAGAARGGALRLSQAVVDAFSHDDVIELVKRKLLDRLSS